MHYIGNRNLVECAVIKAETEKDDFYFKVNKTDIMDALLLIREILSTSNIQFTRIYPIGFQLVKKHEINSLDELNEKLLTLINIYTNVKVAKR